MIVFTASRELIKIRFGHARPSPILTFNTSMGRFQLLLARNIGSQGEVKKTNLGVTKPDVHGSFLKIPGSPVLSLSPLINTRTEYSTHTSKFSWTVPVVSVVGRGTTKRGGLFSSAFGNKHSSRGMKKKFPSTFSSRPCSSPHSSSRATRATREKFTGGALHSLNPQAVTHAHIARADGRSVGSDAQRAADARGRGPHLAQKSCGATAG